VPKKVKQINGNLKSNKIKVGMNDMMVKDISGIVPEIAVLR